MSAFIKGLTDLIPLDELRKFNEKELELLLCDIENIDYDQWKENTSYESDYKNEKPVEWFWEVRTSSTTTRQLFNQTHCDNQLMPLF